MRRPQSQREPLRFPLFVFLAARPIGGGRANVSVRWHSLSFFL